MTEKPMQTWQLTIATLFTLFVFVTVPVTMARGQSPDDELAEDISKLDSFLSDQNLDSFETTVDIESAKWLRRDQRLLQQIYVQGLLAYQFVCYWRYLKARRSS